MKSLNVAIAVPRFPNLVQTYILNQLISLKSRGVNLNIIASEKGEHDNLPNAINDNRLLDSVIYINVDSVSQILKNMIMLPVFNKEYRKAVKNILSYKSGGLNGRYFRLKSLLRARAATAGPYDIIHSHSMFSSFALMFLKQVLSVPLITTYHGRIPEGVKSLDKWKMKIVFEGSDAFLVNTEYAKKDLVKLGCPKSKIHIIPQGIDLENFEFHKRKIQPGKTIRLISVGRLSPEKGHNVALRAINEIIMDCPDLEYHIIGHGPERERLERICAELNLSDHVIFHGFKAGKELNKLFALAHIFILPSKSETQGVVIQEAQACGIPVIANNTGGIPEVIKENITGLLYKENDSMDLAHKIRAIIKDPILYQQLCDYGYSDVKDRFDIDVVSQRLINFYNSVIKNVNQ